MWNLRHKAASGLAATLYLTALTGGCDHCYTSGVTLKQACQLSGTVTASLAPGASFACPPTFVWSGLSNGTGSSVLTIDNSCPADASFTVNVYFPEELGAGTYPLPSSEVLNPIRGGRSPSGG